MILAGRAGARRWLRGRPWAVAGIAFGLLVAAAALVVVDVLEVRRSLRAARQDVGRARALLAEGEVQRAGGRLDDAAEQVREASGAAQGPLWSVLRRVPVVSRSVRVVDGVTGTAGAAVAVGQAAVSQSESLPLGAGQRGLRTSDGRLDLGRIARAHRALGELPTARVEAARERLRGTAVSGVPGPLREARAEVLRLSREVTDGVAAARRLTGVLGPFLGGQDTRRYLVVMQNPAELRGTGGIPGYVSVLAASAGELTMTPPVRHGNFNVAPTAEQATPVQVGAAFRDRYGGVGGNSLFVNSNLDPALPTAAPVMADLYEARTGEAVDGIITVDPIALERMFELLGPLDVPDDVVPDDDSLPDPIPPPRIAETTLIDAYDALGGRSPARRAYLEAIAVSAFRQLLSADWDAVQMGRRMARLAEAKHLQLYSTHGDEQKVFERLDLAGRMDPEAGGSDLLGVNVNNAAGNKMDVHVGHRIAADVTLDLPDDVVDLEAIQRVTRRATIRTTIRNPLPTSGRDIYIIGSFDKPHQEGGTFDKTGLARSWLSLWAPDGTQLTAARTRDGSVTVSSETIHERRAFDYFLETPSRSETWWEADIRGPGRVGVEDGRLVYRLTWWRQAKAVPDHLDLSIRVPDGWRIVDASMSGGGRGAGMGVWGERDPLEIASGENAVSVTGSTTTDVTVEVQIVPDEGLLESLWEGLIP